MCSVSPFLERDRAPHRCFHPFTSTCFQMLTSTAVYSVADCLTPKVTAGYDSDHYRARVPAVHVIAPLAVRPSLANPWNSCGSDAQGAASIHLYSSTSRSVVAAAKLAGEPAQYCRALLHREHLHLEAFALCRNAECKSWRSNQGESGPGSWGSWDTAQQATPRCGRAKHCSK